MSGIRVTYSGLVSFAISLTSVFTGLVFTIIVTRRLSPEEFGTWTLIGGFLTYVLVIEPIISYWTTREVARGIESGRTAIFFGSIFSVIGMVVYLLIAFFVGQQTNTELEPIFYAVLLVPVTFVTKILNAINLGWKPQAISYGLLAFEISKIPLALFLVYFFDMGLIGAIIATVIAYIANIIILLIHARDRLKNKIKIKFLKKWIKFSWLPLYPGIGNIILYFDVAIYSVTIGSVVGLAYFGIANTIANIVGQSGNISRGIYPKLLGGGKSEVIGENLSLLFYFVFPLTAISISFAKPGLFVLNPIYEIAVPVVVILTCKVFFDVIGGIYGSILIGLEKVDIDKKSRFKDYIKSKLFLVPTIRIIQFGSYVGILTIMLLSFKTSQELDLVIYWSIISLGTQIFYTAYLYVLVRKSVSIKVDFVALLKYLLVSAVLFGIVYLLMEEFLIYKTSIFDFLPSLFPYLALGVFGYLGITYLIDQRTKNLFKAITNEIKKGGSIYGNKK